MYQRFSNRVQFEFVSFVWIDLRSQRTAPNLYDEVCAACLASNDLDRPPGRPSQNEIAHSFPAFQISEIAAIEGAIYQLSPGLLLFEFDYPDRIGLDALRQTKIRHPALPVFMVTKHHSEALAVWAFRSGVRDYLVTPQDPKEIARRISAVHLLGAGRGETAPRQPYCFGQIVPFDIQFAGLREDHKKTLAADSYIEAHFHEFVRLSTVSKLCKLSMFQFSRVFKKEHGVTFSKFLQKYRIRRAAEMFASSRGSVSDVGFAVGFTSLSYFDRVFRRHTGVSPSQYLLRASNRTNIRKSHDFPVSSQRSHATDAKKS